VALGTGYDQQGCYLARALEVVGERWTLLILRDCFYGVRRFTDLREHLDISRAVLIDRLDTLVGAGVLTREDSGGHPEYLLTEAGRALWPAIFALSKWGEQYTSGPHPSRIFSHASCDTDIDDLGRCPTCGQVPGPDDLVVRLGPGGNAMRRSDRVARVLEHPHRMLTPIGAAADQAAE
jgi:DNA-binding HxlR family transcriptional regulator